MNLSRAAEVHFFLPYPPQTQRADHSLFCSNPLHPCRLLLCFLFSKLNMPPLPIFLWRRYFLVSEHCCCCPLGALQLLHTFLEAEVLSLISCACRQWLHTSLCWSLSCQQAGHPDQAGFFPAELLPDHCSSPQNLSCQLLPRFAFAPLQQGEIGFGPASLQVSHW